MISVYMKARKKVLSYFKLHPEYNAFVHAVGGIGIGILIASPFANPHPLRWGLFFLIVSLLGHLYTLQAKK